MRDDKDAPLLPVATLLTPAERARVDAAGEGYYHAFHRDSVDAIIDDAKQQPLQAVVVSVTYAASHATRLASFVREFPRIPALAVLSDLESRSAQTVLTLGRSGINRLIDVRVPNGWRELRGAIMADAGQGIQRIALSQLRDDLEGITEDCWQFFEVLFTCAPRVSSIRMLANEFGILPSTLMSRFFRAQLPTPKQYLALARLVRAARLFENAGFSVANVSNHLEYSSSQSFGRHIRMTIGLTANQFRTQYDGVSMFQRFREELVLPYKDVLLQFQPFTPQSYIRRQLHSSDNL